MSEEWTELEARPVPQSPGPGCSVDQNTRERHLVNPASPGPRALHLLTPQWGPASPGPLALHLLTPQWGAPCLSPCWWASKTEALTLERFEAS